ncbi:MAG: metallophosphoesterase [Acidobacteriota bacterium]
MPRALISILLFSLTFTTASVAPQPSQASQAPVAPRVAAPAYFFIQISDPQFGMFTADEDVAQEIANFSFAIANINRLKPAFVVITGDLVNKAGDAAQMAAYARLRKTIAKDIPVYEMPGNHDVENTPTPETVAAYRRAHGRDYYTFTYSNLLGIVLDSTLIHTPDKASADAGIQRVWLEGELKRAKASGARHIVVFQHHPWFLEKADEPDQYFNIPLVRRTPLLQLFHETGVTMLVSGHYHRNAVARDGDIEAITTGPVGMPLGGAKSGMRIFLVTSTGITHRYVEFGELPTSIEPEKGFVERK